jgi:hypothetical protein
VPAKSLPAKDGALAPHDDIEGVPGKPEFAAIVLYVALVFIVEFPDNRPPVLKKLPVMLRFIAFVTDKL